MQSSTREIQRTQRNPSSLERLEEIGDRQEEDETSLDRIAGVGAFEFFRCPNFVKRDEDKPPFLFSLDLGFLERKMNGSGENK